jgi:hypothetical protein
MRADTFLDAWLTAAGRILGFEHIPDELLRGHGLWEIGHPAHCAVEDSSCLSEIKDTLGVQLIDQSGGDGTASQCERLSVSVSHDDSLCRLRESKATIKDNDIQSSA